MRIDFAELITADELPGYRASAQGRSRDGCSHCRPMRRLATEKRLGMPRSRSRRIGSRSKTC